MLKAVLFGAVMLFAGCGAPAAGMFAGEPEGCGGGTTLPFTGPATGAGGEGAGGSGDAAQGGAGAAGGAVGGGGGSDPATSGAGGQGGGGGGDPCAGLEPVLCAGTECGPVLADCDGDGGAEMVECGACALPEMCGDNGKANTCGSTCLSVYGFICQANGLPSAWGVLGSCTSQPYRVVNGQVVVRSAGLDACAVGFETGGQSYTCCPE